MQATILYGPRDVRVEERPDPTILEPTDAVIRIAAACVCGSDLWPYRGVQAFAQPTPMGHEYCGIVEEVGRDVRTIRPGQFVVGSFATSDNTCAHCQHGYQSSCVHREFLSGAQAPFFRVPLADGTLVATADVPPDHLIPSLLATSGVVAVSGRASSVGADYPSSFFARRRSPLRWPSRSCG
jgi:threonine dehydrogenase-like Zn-dependent dehydrogenase